MTEESKEIASPEEAENYFRKWYQRNRDRVLAERRKRWRKDPEYRRQNVLRKRAFRAKERKRKEQFREEMLGTIIALLERDGFDQAMIDKALSYFPRGARGFPKVVSLSSGHYVVYPMGYLSVRLARAGQTIRIWHQREILPPATYVDEQNWRWYSWGYIKSCAKAARNVRESGSWSLDKFKKAVEESFGLCE